MGEKGEEEEIEDVSRALVDGVLMTKTHLVVVKQNMS